MESNRYHFARGVRKRPADGFAGARWSERSDGLSCLCLVDLVAGRRHRKNEFKDRTVGAGLIEAHGTAMDLHDLLDHRQAEAGALLLSKTDKGIEESVANRFRDTRSVVLNENLNEISVTAAAHLDFACLQRERLASIEEQVVDGPLQFARVTPTCTVSVA